MKIEERLQDREFLCADRFTVADICVGYALILAESVGLDDGVPESLKAYRKRLTQREAYLKAFEREDGAAPGRFGATDPPACTAGAPAPCPTAPPRGH